MVPRYKYTRNTVNVRAQALFDSNNMNKMNFKFADVTAYMYFVEIIGDRL